MDKVEELLKQTGTTETIPVEISCSFDCPHCTAQQEIEYCDYEDLKVVMCTCCHKLMVLEKD